MKTRRLLRLVLIGTALVLGGCASFQREFVAAAHPTAAARKADPFAGAWDGQWLSEKHRKSSGEEGGGRLRCIFTPIDATHYRAHFFANWLCFATGYHITVHTERQGKVLIFDGEQDLNPIFGGVYRYNGKVTPERFDATFSCAFDRGRFEMTRPTLP